MSTRDPNEDDVDDDFVDEEEDSVEFRARLSTFLPITRERKATLLNEATLFQPSSDKRENDFLDPRKSTSLSGTDETDEICVVKKTSNLFAERIEADPLHPKIPKLAPIRVTSSPTANESPTLVVQFWQGLPGVKESGLLKRLDKEQIAMNEAVFEIIKSSKSYYKSLCVIIDHFKQNFEEKFGSRFKYLCQQLFLNIPTLAKVTDRLINRLEEVQGDSLEMRPECIGVVRFFAENLFEEPYLKYCSRQDQQQAALNEIEKNKEMSAYLQTLERDPICQMLPLGAFLLLPMQMLTRWPILLLAVQKYTRLPKLHFDVNKTITQVEKLALTCNSYREKLAHEQKLIQIEKSIIFPKNMRYSLTTEKSKTKIFYEGEFQAILPNKESLQKSKSFVRKLRSNMPDNVHLITFDDGSVIILQKDSKDCLRFVNYAPIWSAVTETAKIAENLGDRVKIDMRLSKVHDLTLVTLYNATLSQPSKILFLFKKNSSISSQMLLECVKKSPPIPRLDPRTVFSCDETRLNTNNNEDISDDDSPTSRFNKTLQWAKSTENLNSRPKTQSFTLPKPTQPITLTTAFGSLDELDREDESDDVTEISPDDDMKNERSSTLEEVLTDVSEASKRRRSVPSRYGLRASSPAIQVDICHITKFEFPDLDGNPIAMSEDQTDDGQRVPKEMRMLTKESKGSKFPVKVIKAYKHEKIDELDVEKGDVVDVEHGPIYGWVYGKKRANKKSGWFPYNHTRPVKSIILKVK